MLPVASTTKRRFEIWSVPTTLWAYGLLRALAFAAPTWDEGGRVGAGVAVVAVIYVFAVRGSRRALSALVLLDTFSFVIVTMTWLSTRDTALVVPVLTAGALACLIAPATRRFVARPAGNSSEHGAQSTVHDRHLGGVNRRTC